MPRRWPGAGARWPTPESSLLPPPARPCQGARDPVPQGAAPATRAVPDALHKSRWVTAAIATSSCLFNLCMLNCFVLPRRWWCNASYFKM